MCVALSLIMYKAWMRLSSCSISNLSFTVSLRKLVYKVSHLLRIWILWKKNSLIGCKLIFSAWSSKVIRSHKGFNAQIILIAKFHASFISEINYIWNMGKIQLSMNVLFIHLAGWYLFHKFSKLYRITFADLIHKK